MAERPVIETLGENFGYAFSLEDAYNFIRELERQTTTRFTCYRADKGFGAIGEIGSLLKSKLSAKGH